MTVQSQIAKQLRDFYYGGNWTAVSLKENVEGLTWQQATTKLDSFNTIAMLVCHMHYYVNAVMTVLQGKPLNASDKFSFNVPPIQSQEDWENLLNKTWAEVNEFANLVEQLPESRLWENLAGEKYGNIYRNIHGIIEHNHYHLGQIVLIKKLITQKNPASS